MMRIKSYLGKSTIHGLGVFAAEPVKKDQLVWSLDKRFDILFPFSELDTLDDITKKLLSIYAYVDRLNPNHYVLCPDDGRFWNHSPTPNTRDYEDKIFAARDIAAHEETTCDYNASFISGPLSDWMPGAF